MGTYIPTIRESVLRRWAACRVYRDVTLTCGVRVSLISQQIYSKPICIVLNLANIIFQNNPNNSENIVKYGAFQKYEVHEFQIMTALIEKKKLKYLGFKRRISSCQIMVLLLKYLL